MNNKGNILVFKNDTLSLVKTLKEGYWLYDSVRGMNIAMSAETEQSAFIEALMYYQKRLSKVELEFKTLDNRVCDFVDSFREDED